MTILIDYFLWLPADLSIFLSSVKVAMAALFQTHHVLNATSTCNERSGTLHCKMSHSLGLALIERLFPHAMVVR